MVDASRNISRKIGLRMWLSGGWLLFLFLATLFAPIISPHDPLAQDLFASRLPPIWMDGYEPTYYLGSDSLGRDVLSRILYGARIALLVALIASTATCIIGATLGVLAGYFGGWVDLVISRLVDIWMAFPPVLFAILLIAVLGTGLTSIIIAIIVIRTHAKKVQETQGKQIPVLLISIGLIFILPLLSFLIGGVRLSFEVPVLKQLATLSLIHI